MVMATGEAKFAMGKLLATPGALKALEEAGETALPLLGRHLRGDWGIVGAEDAKRNDEALESGARLLSAYRLRNGTKLWVITEAADENGNRAATTILLPEEY
ncbi:MAG: hypothetical protein M5U26_11705 [Planctomycetota bacterium]|nr:hypothetical protein [Planctomycetota bacterium]